MGKLRVVITFHTTTEAMAFEQACKAQGLPGRIIPMPVAISAQCGLAWQVAAGEKVLLLRRAQELGLKYDRVVELK